MSDYLLHNTYTCPFCFQGEIKNLLLMEAFSCNFCQHIFSVDLGKQVLQIEDSEIPIRWHWNGQSWQRIKGKDGLDWSFSTIVLLSILFVSLPTMIVGSGAYLFPPLEGSKLSWFPWFWTILAFISHLICLIWLIIEYLQFPLGLYLRGKAQRWLGMNF